MQLKRFKKNCDVSKSWEMRVQAAIKYIKENNDNLKGLYVVNYHSNRHVMNHHYIMIM